MQRVGLILFASSILMLSFGCSRGAVPGPGDGGGGSTGSSTGTTGNGATGSSSSGTGSTGGATSTGGTSGSTSSGGTSSSGGTGGGPSPVALTLDATALHQTIAGWGAELPVEYSPSLAQRAEIISLVYGTLNLTSTQAGSLLEAPVADFTKTQNSDPDAGVINWAGFQGWSEQDVHDNWIELPSTTLGDAGTPLTAAQLGLTGYVLGESFPNVRWENPWLDAIRTSNPPLYLAYVTRELLAYHLYWQSRWGAPPALFQFGNEEISGNHALYAGGSVDNYPGGSTQELVDLVKAGGQLLAANGFGNVKFLVSTEETVSKSLAVASAILADPQARPFVGAISYHEYPYGSAYSDLALVLGASGQGKPPAAEIQVRNQIRDLGKQYGVPVWLTEVSHASVSGLSGASFDTLRARAIDIHDNLIYADAAAFWLQGNEWDTVAEKGHFGRTETADQLQVDQGGDMAVLGDPTTDVWQITMGGYALGHYARWVHPGAVRIDASSDAPLVQVAAFRDDSRGTISLVIINNDSQDHAIQIALSGTTFSGSVSGEQSTSAATLQPVTVFAPVDAHHASLVVTAESVTSLQAPAGP